MESYNEALVRLVDDVDNIEDEIEQTCNQAADFESID